MDDIYSLCLAYFHKVNSKIKTAKCPLLLNIVKSTRTSTSIMVFVLFFFFFFNKFIYMFSSLKSLDLTLKIFEVMASFGESCSLDNCEERKWYFVRKKQL